MYSRQRHPGSNHQDSRRPIKSDKVHGVLEPVDDLDGVEDGVGDVVPPPRSAAGGAGGGGLVHLREEVLARAEGCQVGVHHGGRAGDALCAPHVGVAEIIAELVEVVCGEAVVVLDDCVVAGAAGT